MFIQPLALIVTIAGIAVPSQQDLTDLMLAVRFGKESTRPAAVSEVVAAGSEKVPLLLSWTRNPPGGVDKQQLYIGMADAFGELKTREAIPFLIKYINLKRNLSVGSNIWMKAAGVREARLPAVAALIKIDPEASRSLIEAYWGPMTLEDRKATIFTIGMIKDPQNRGFLEGVAVYGKETRRDAEEGLKLLDEPR